MNAVVSVISLLGLLSISVEGFFLTAPTHKAVIVGTPVTFTCSTKETGYTLLFTYNAPPGHRVNSQIITEDLPDGGTKTATTFIVTRELNTTSVTCVAAGTAHSTDPATVYALPNKVDNVRLCQLDRFVFISWDPVLTIEGIDITYRIMHNVGPDIVTLNTHYSFDHNAIEEYNYTANFSVIPAGTDNNQMSYSNASCFVCKLNGTRLLDLDYIEDLTSRSGKEQTQWSFITKIPLNVTECTINSNTFNNATLESCNAENCTNSTSVNYIENNQKINSTNHLPPRQRYNNTLHFTYLGREITSQPFHTSTHDIQDIDVISTDTSASLCLWFYLVHHYKVKWIHLHIEREEELIPFNVTVPVNMNETRFKWCADPIPATSSNNNGNWSLFACDGQGGKCNNPAKILNNILLNFVYFSILTTNANTHTMRTTTTTTSLSSSYSMSTVISSSTPLPSSEATKNSSLQLSVIVSGLVGILLLIVAVVVVVAVVVAVMSRNRNEKEIV